VCHWSGQKRIGKAAEKGGKPEDLPYCLPCRYGALTNTASSLGQVSWVQPFESIRLKGLFLCAILSTAHPIGGILKSGAIICICGSVPDAWTAEDSRQFKETTANFSKVRIITPGISAFMMNRLWINLISDGITEVVVAVAEFNQKSGLQIKPNSIRFSVVGMN
jgi:hypothetical protein